MALAQNEKVSWRGVSGAWRRLAQQRVAADVSGICGSEDETGGYISYKRQTKQHHMRQKRRS
jgi:hypothetical protein